MKEIHVKLSDDAANRWKSWLRSDAWVATCDVGSEQVKMDKLLAEVDAQRKRLDTVTARANCARDLFESMFGAMPFLREGTKWIYQDGHEEEG